jgi:signal transduction histidine kinase
MPSSAVVQRLNVAAERVRSTPADVALALGATLLVAFDLDYTGVHPLLGVGVALPALLTLVWRRRAPVVVATVVCATNLMLSLASTNPYGSQLASIAVILAIYTVAAHCDGRRAVVGALLTLPLVVLAQAATKEGTIADFLGELIWAASWIAGRVVRRRTLEAARIATEATLRAQQREDEAREAVGRERDRIARELHDVVAHAVSLVVVQAGAERLALGTTAPRTRGVLDSIETAGRQALVELRAMLAVLRTDDDTVVELGPQPDLDALPALVERVRAAGLAVDVDVDLRGPLPAGVGLSAYRIVQEALTNALKHSPTSATVTVHSTATEVVVEVRNPRTATSPSAPHDIGRGLVGMRERAALHGGDLTAGPEGDVWVVRARLPLTPAGSVATA